MGQFENRNKLLIIVNFHTVFLQITLVSKKE